MIVYRDDCGHELDEDDFIPYLRQLIADLQAKGLREREVMNELFEEDFFGDNIINEAVFFRIRSQFLFGR